MEATTAAIHYYCKYQERCHQEVRNKLYELGCHKAEVEEYIVDLIEAGLLNEERFAGEYARGKFRMKHWGRVKIRVHLKQKGVSDYCIKKAFTQIQDEEYEKTLQKLAERKFLELKKERSVVAKKYKLSNYLLQKGYEADLVYPQVNILLGIEYN